MPFLGRYGRYNRGRYNAKTSTRTGDFHHHSSNGKAYLHLPVL